jgi:cytochrome c553
MKTTIKKLTLLSIIALALFFFGPAETTKGALTKTIPQTAVDFDRDIRPIFATSCLKCHGEKKQSAGLRLDAKSHAMRGGQSGPAITQGKSAESLLIKRVAPAHEDERMPPAGDPLTAAQIAMLKAWIDAGAVWPESDADRASAHDKRLDHWAWQALKRPQPPAATSYTLKIRRNCKRRDSGCRRRRIDASSSVVCPSICWGYRPTRSESNSS